MSLASSVEQLLQEARSLVKGSGEKLFRLAQICSKLLPEQRRSKSEANPVRTTKLQRYFIDIRHSGAYDHAEDELKSIVGCMNVTPVDLETVYAHHKQRDKWISTPFALLLEESRAEDDRIRWNSVIEAGSDNRRGNPHRNSGISDRGDPGRNHQETIKRTRSLRSKEDSFIDAIDREIRHAVDDGIGHSQIVSRLQSYWEELKAERSKELEAAKKKRNKVA